MAIQTTIVRHEQYNYKQPTNTAPSRHQPEIVEYCLSSLEKWSTSCFG